MTNQEIYKIPIVEVESREDLIKILTSNLCNCVFEQIQEVTNPVGLQWNYIFSTKINFKDFCIAIVVYKEALFEKPDVSKQIIGFWLKESVPAITNCYRGILKP